MRIGLIQTHAIGDILIALPIAQFFNQQGHEVYWPIDENYCEMFREATPGNITFLPISRDEFGFRSLEYFLTTPTKLLIDAGCEKIIPLYSAMGHYGINFINPTYTASLKFDEYKYAIAGVPFTEKWNLKINRNTDREKKLMDQINIHEEFILLHEIAGDGDISRIEIPAYIKDQYKILRIDSLTSSIFDWIPIYEAALGIFFIDSAHANLVEQLNIGRNKHLKLRSSTSFTPVFKNGWIFL